MADPNARPIDRLLGGYLLLSGLALLFPHRGPGWSALLLVHLLVGGLLLAGGTGWVRKRVGSRLPPLVDWYPLLLVPFLYWELPHLIGAVRADVFFDAVVMGWEESIFGHQPSTTLAARLDHRLLSELLHLAYLAYYPVLYFFPLALYLQGRTDVFRDTVFTVMFGFILSYLGFLLLPVQGPRYLFPAPGGEAATAWLYGVTHAVLESGSSRGAAFPSAHAALAVVQTVNAMRHLPAAAPVLAAVTIGISVGAVYGGFHYAVDVLAGLALGLVAAAVAPALRKALR